MYVRNAHGEYKKIDIVISGNCAVKGCTNPASDESHVRKCKANGELLSHNIYVVKMCTTHNRSKTDDVLELNADIIPQPINP